MKKNKIKLTESQLRQIIVKNINESIKTKTKTKKRKDYFPYQEYLQNLKCDDDFGRYVYCPKDKNCEMTEYNYPCIIDTNDIEYNSDDYDTNDIEYNSDDYDTNDNEYIGPEISISSEFNPDEFDEITENMRKNKVKLTESQLRKVIKESVKKILKEYAGYNSLERAYGEQDYMPYGKHLNRVGLAGGYTRSDAERELGYQRTKRNSKNLDPLRLRLSKENPYNSYLSRIASIKGMKKDAMGDLKDKVLRGNKNK